MYGFTAVFRTRWRSSIGHLIRSPLPCHSFIYSPPSLRAIHPNKQIICFRVRTFATKIINRRRYSEYAKSVLKMQTDAEIVWWMKKLVMFYKTSSVELVPRIGPTNILGLDPRLKGASVKRGELNWELLLFKLSYPHDVLLYRAGDFFEAVGYDACISVEYADLNPVGGSDSVPKARSPSENLPQTLDDLTRNGFSVCIVEEVYDPTTAFSLRYLSGRATPEYPYIFDTIRHYNASTELKNMQKVDYQVNSNTFFQGVVSLIYPVCEHTLTNLYKVPCETVKSLRFILVNPGEEPFTSDSPSNCIYVILRRAKNKIIVGQTSDIGAEIRKYRSKRAMKRALFVYCKVFEEWTEALQKAIVDVLPRYGFIRLY